MKLFISYSRDDKAWVYEFWRVLGDKANHDAWIDRRLVPAQDWWHTILDNIEGCDCFIYVLSPKSVESIYCQAELKYALALNKPILPVMLKKCDYPSELSQIQHLTIYDDMSLEYVLFMVVMGLHNIEKRQLKGEFQPRTGPHPDVPTPAKKPEQVSEVFMLAEEAASENNLSLAEKLFEQVMSADPQGWGLAAAERLGEIRFERDRNRDYLNVVQMANNPALVRGARAAAKVFVQKYGTEYDPSSVVGNLVRPPTPTIIRRSSSLDLMPKPFDWIDIPAGKVTLEAGGYAPKGGQTFDVPAFTIAKYPLTNAQFAMFIKGKGYEQRQWWTEDGWKMREEQAWTEPRYWQDEKWRQVEYPVVGVSWYEAVAFCKWLSDVTDETIMLPTEQQWQRAAQGDTKYAYP
jgi:hypothetical protein